MAAKKKTGSSAGASVGKKMTSSTTPKGPTYKGQTVNWDKPGTRKPTEAITQKGQKATGLSKSTVAGNRFSSTAKGTGSENMAGTFVKKAAETVAKGTIALSGAGAVSKAAMKPTKGNIAKAALSVAPIPVGKIGSFAAKNSYALGKTVVHGSPVKGLKKIVPNTGSVARPTEKVNFSWNTSSKYSGTLGNNASTYSKGTGSVYVGKVPRGSIVKDPNKGIVVSKAPIKVKKEISPTSKNLENKIDKAIPGSTVRKVKKSVEAKKRETKIKKSNKNSVA